jgi:hypothetical protein
MTSAERDLSVSLNLPFVSIGTSSLGAWVRRRPRPSPYLLISVTCGLALDATGETGQGVWPRLRRPNGKSSQLWWLSAVGSSGEVRLVSAANGMCLDAGRDVGREPPVADLWLNSGTASQKWRVSSSPDDRAAYLTNADCGLLLDVAWDSSHESHPAMCRRHGGENQHWVIAKPFTVKPE